MSTFKSSIMILLYPKDGFAPFPAHAAFPSAKKLDYRKARFHQEEQDSQRWLQTYLRRYRWKMRAMNSVFGQVQPTDSTRSRKRREQRLFDEQAMSRMADEGCPNGRQEDEPSKRIVRQISSGSIDHRLVDLPLGWFTASHTEAVGSLFFACITRFVALRRSPKEER